MTMFRAIFLLGVAACIPPALGADANAGKVLFRRQCALCHSAEANDNGGAQGPSLQRVFGRRAASDPDFSYTKALRASNLMWDESTLDRFLSAPSAVVPGTAMFVALARQDDRQNIIAYFEALKTGAFEEAAAKPVGPPPGMPAANAGPPRVGADWKNDRPGRMHRIDVATLPAPFASSSASNFPKLVSKPAQATLSVPAGFKVGVFATGLESPRTMLVAPNGDIFVSETRTGMIKVMHASADGAKAASVATFAQGLSLPSGLALYPAGDHPQWLYVAETNRVVRYAYDVGAQKAGEVLEIIVPELSPVGGGGHFARDLAFSPDGRRMFVSVGSGSNVAADMPKKSAAEVKSWESAHGLGAAWGGEENRADVLVFEMDSNTPGKPVGKRFATGIRNCNGLTIQPATGALWCTTNERDMLGDDLVPDYSTRVKEGAFYGWPWYYLGDHEDPRLKGDRPDLAGKVTVPDVLYQAHSAALNLVFYPANTGKSAFPKEYVGDGFAVMHGSWNRTFRTGHKIVRVLMKDGVPTGDYQDFLVGFIADDGNAWARPVGAAVAQDGSLLMSDDGGNLIYRISYAR